jgi:autotransporter-associated beta strand protein
MTRRPPRLLVLEDRLAPAIATWDGGGGNNNWTTAANWVGDVAPNPGDDLAFPSGAAQLTNVNDFAAGTLFTSLSVTGNGYAISGNGIMFATGASADIPSAASSTLALPLAGAGGLTKAGPGTLVLSGANSYSGLTAVNGGTLSIQANTALGASGVGNETLVADGATLTFDAHVLNVAESISLTEPAATGPNVPALRVPGFGAITLSGPLTVVAAVNSNAAIVRGNSPGSSLTITSGVGESGGVGDIRFQSITVAFAASSANSLTGQTLVSDGGQAFFNGQGGSSPVSNVFFALLGGTGSMGPVTVGGLADADITAADDLSVGTLTTGDFTLQARVPPVGGDGELIVNLTSSGGTALADRINVNGTVQLGGQLALRPGAGFVLPPGGHLVIIGNDGSDPVMGTFRDIPEGATISLANGNTVRVTYHGGDGNDVELSSTAVSSRFAVGAGAGGFPVVNVYNANGSLIHSFFAYEQTFRGGVHVATADVTGDGVADTITAPGFGGGPVIRIWDGVTGAMVRQFNAYDPAFRGGAFVASSDIDADGRKDIITGAGAGGGPHVKVFSGLTGATLSSFLAYSPQFLGGVSVAGTDGANVPIAHVHYNGTIITGAGPGGGPHVRTFDGITGIGYGSFFAYAQSFTGGVNVAVGQFGPIDTGGPNIVTAPASAGQPDVRVYNSQGQRLASFFAYAPAFTGGVSVAVQPIGVGGTDAILTGAGPGGGPHVEQWEFPGPVTTRSFFAFDPAFTGGVFVG